MTASLCEQKWPNIKVNSRIESINYHPPRPATTHFVDGVNGVQLALDVWPASGHTKRAVLMVHGLASNARLWDGVAKHLYGLGHLVATLDQRGHGRSDKPDGLYDFPTVCGDLVHVINYLSTIDDRWKKPIVIGQSWGADVALELACLSPLSVTGVACIDGGISDLADHFPQWESCKAALRPPHLIGRPVAELQETLRRHHYEWSEDGIRAVMANFEVRDDLTVAPWLTFDHHLDILHSLWAYKPSARHSLITVPVLFMPAQSGKDARPVSGRLSKSAAVAIAAERVERSRVHWFLDSGHDVHVERPKEVAEVLHEAAATFFV